MENDDLFDMAGTVNSREEFVRFVGELSRDLAAGGDEWENTDLSSYMSGLSGFAQDMDGYYKNMGEVVDTSKMTWRMAAQMLLAATVYGN